MSAQPTVSAQMAVCHAIVALLLASPALALGKITANRRRPMAADVVSQVFVYVEESQAERGAIKGAPFDWRTRIRVECVARDCGPVDADTAADALATQVYARILEDTTLGGSVLDVEPVAMAWTGDEADTTLSAAQLLFTVWHVTADNALAAPVY